MLVRRLHLSASLTLGLARKHGLHLLPPPHSVFSIHPAQQAKEWPCLEQDRQRGPVGGNCIFPCAVRLSVSESVALCCLM